MVVKLLAEQERRVGEFLLHAFFCVMICDEETAAETGLALRVVVMTMVDQLHARSNQMESRLHRHIVRFC